MSKWVSEWNYLLNSVKFSSAQQQSITQILQFWRKKKKSSVLLPSAKPPNAIHSAKKSQSGFIRFSLWHWFFNSLRSQLAEVRLASVVCSNPSPNFPDCTAVSCHELYEVISQTTIWSCTIFSQQLPNMQFVSNWLGGFFGLSLHGNTVFNVKMKFALINRDNRNLLFSLFTYVAWNDNRNFSNRWNNSLVLPLAGKRNKHLNK